MTESTRKFMDEIHMDDRYQPLTHGAFVYYTTDSGEVSKMYLSKSALEQINADIELEKARESTVWRT